MSDVMPSVNAPGLRTNAGTHGDALDGGGAVGALMRSIDWATTPLGPVEQWPQSLKTTVSTCLNSRFPILVWWGPDLIKLYNDAYAQLLGAKHPRALGRPGREVWAEIWDIIGPMLEGVMSRGEATWSDDQMLPLHRYDYTEECYFTFTYSPIRDETGGVGGVFCAVIETTERVLGSRRLTTLRELGGRIAAERRTAEDACRAAAAVLDGNPADVPFALLYLLDGDGTIAHLAGSSGLPPGEAASPSRIDLTAEPHECQGWPIAAVTRTGRVEQVDDLRARFGSLPGGPWPETTERALALPIARAGQDQRPWGVLVAGVSPRRALDDDYRAFFDLVAGSIATAIANARTYEEEQRRVAALAEIDRAKTEFFSNVSHELRTPLSLLLAPTEDILADRVTPLDRAHRERLEVVHRNGLRLLTLVNALLEFSRVEAGRVDACYESTDLPAYSAELASTFRSAIEKAGLRLVVDCPPLPSTLEPAYVDRAMWEKIVLNLLSNAFKHTFEGEIVVRTRAVAGRFELEVRDTGVGIPADQISRVFTRFHRVPNAKSRTHEGTGIGLALVQELVRLHGGSVEVASEEGAGTSFTIGLPLGAEHLPVDSIGAPRPDAARGSPDTHAAEPYVEEARRWMAGAAPGVTATSARARSLCEVHGRVLLADDNADMREYLARLLADAGWNVDAVSDGEAALDAVRVTVPDLVLADVMMPRLDGFALLRALRDDARTAAVPVILVSARAGEEARVEGLEAGADDYLVKPFGARELIARVAAHVALARVRERARAELAVAGARLSNVLAQAPVAIAVLRGPEHVFDVVNAHYRQLIGGRDVVGRSIRDALPELAGQGIFEILDDVFRTKVPFVGNELRTRIDRSGTGETEEVFFNFVYQPLFDAAGDAEGIAVVATDVTDLVRTRHAAEQAQREAELANRAKSEFLAAMSHELRTPLNAIAGYVQLIEMGVHGPINAAQRQALGRVQTNERHLLALITDVLNFAKLEAGRIEYAVRDVGVAALVADTSAIIEPQFAAKGIAYAVDIAADLAVRADEDKLRQILLNLLSNALKFTEPGGRVVVDATTRDEGPDGGRRDFIFLRVADSGVGIPRDRQPTIFDPFVQVHRHIAHSAEGTGLGLSISRDLARGMRGDLRVRSFEGEGSVFTVMLPAARPQPVAAPDSVALGAPA